MVTIRSVRLPDEVVEDVDEITRRRGIKSFNQLVLGLIEKELDVKRWMALKESGDFQEHSGKRIVITPRIMQYIYEKDIDLTENVEDGVEEIYGYVSSYDFDDLLAKGLIKADGSPVDPWIFVGKSEQKDSAPKLAEGLNDSPEIKSPP